MVIWAVAGLIGGLLLAEVLIQVRFVPLVMAMFNNSPHFCAATLPPDHDAERFETKTADGLTICGALYRQTDRAARGLVVFCHEFRSNGWSSMLYGSALWKAGFDVLAFDFRNHGDSDEMPGYQTSCWLTSYEVTDLHAVLDYVQQQDDLRKLPLGLFGISRGGSAALAVATQRKEVRCVAVESAFGTKLMMAYHATRWMTFLLGERLSAYMPWWHIHITLWLARLVNQFRFRVRYIIVENLLHRLQQLPMIFISGDRDTYVLPAVAQEICRLAGKPDVLWLVPHAKHNLARQVDPGEYDRRLVNFFGVLDSQAEAPTHADLTANNSGLKASANKPRKAR